MSTPIKRKATGGPSSANASPAKKPLATGSTTASYPAIRSWVTLRDPAFVVDNLPEDKQKLYDMIKHHLDTLDMEDPRLNTRKRDITNRVQAIAAMTSLYMPMSHIEWAPWAEDLSPPAPAPNVHLRFIAQFHDETQRMVSIWKQTPPVAEERSGTKRPPEADRDQELIHERYADICILTGNNWGSQACHIVASAIRRNPQSRFWEALGAFWSKPQLERLREHLRDPRTEEQDLLMLDSGIHKAWTTGRVAFKPLPSTEDNNIKLEVHILSNMSPGSVVHELRCDDPTDKDNYQANITDSRTGKVIHTGDIIHVVTDDPKDHPLPSSELLTLQYHVQRVLRAAAAAASLTRIFDHNMDPDTDITTADIQGNWDPECTYSEIHPGFYNFLVGPAINQGIIPSDSEVATRTFAQP